MAKAFNRLTRIAMRKLSAGGKLNEHGITFERLADGDGVFTVNVMVDGLRIHRVVGRESDGATRTQAEEFIAQARNDARHDRLALPRGRKLALSFEDAAHKYLQKLAEEGGRNVNKKRTQLELHLIPFFGMMPLSKITTSDVERYKKHRQEQHAIKSNALNKGCTFKDAAPSAGTVNRELAALSHLFSKAVEWAWLDRRPAKINRLREESGRITYLTIEQVAQLKECAKADSSELIYPFIVIALGSSMRKMEILRLRREHVDTARRVLYIPKAKAGAREQPITDETAEFLEAYVQALPPGTPWLFPSPGAKDGHAIDIRKPFIRVVVAAGLDPKVVVRHTLRHTAITHLVQAGVDLPTVKRVSGHKTLAMVERYSHQNGAHIQSAMDKLESRLSSIARERKISV
ncbi:MAG: tyrosine-type recombinase/integrase [Nevskia sp.]|nr:tyrosine-type recombinase/integrase [Nevskia sp.]